MRINVFFIALALLFLGFISPLHASSGTEETYDDPKIEDDEEVGGEEITPLDDDKNKPLPKPVTEEWERELIDWLKGLSPEQREQALKDLEAIDSCVGNWARRVFETWEKPD
jgi:hypothetical protein